MRTKKPSRLTKRLVETADAMRRAGVRDAATHAKITLLTSTTRPMSSPS